MHRHSVYKKWILCDKAMDNLHRLYTLSTKLNNHLFKRSSLYKPYPQTINKLKSYIHTNSHPHFLRDRFYNLSTKSTGPMKANLNNLIKGLIV